jgi:hypothetical protein
MGGKMDELDHQLANSVCEKLQETYKARVENCTYNWPGTPMIWVGRREEFYSRAYVYFHKDRVELRIPDDGPIFKYEYADPAFPEDLYEDLAKQATEWKLWNE